MDDLHDRMELRGLVRGLYDMQKIRIQTGNRICANFRSKLGQNPGQREEILEDDKKKILETLRKRYRKITEGIVRFPSKAQFQGDNLISSYTEFCLIRHYDQLIRVEEEHFARLKDILTDFSLFNEFLLGVKGCGVKMSAVILSEIDITKCKYAASMWAYCGLDVAEDGKGRSKRKEHQVLRPYTTRDGKEELRWSITFNPFIKSKLLGVLGPSFLKQKSSYKDVYDNYKRRLENHPNWAETSLGHRHNAAIRYMIKIFLIDVYKEWRRIKGLPVYAPYHEAKLGLVHGAVESPDDVPLDDPGIDNQDTPEDDVTQYWNQDPDPDHFEDPYENIPPAAMKNK